MFATQHLVIFICENNGYAEATATDWHLNTKELSDITQAYNMKSYQGDGNDVFEVYRITKNAILESKKNEIPIFLEFIVPFEVSIPVTFPLLMFIPVTSQF